MSTIGKTLAHYEIISQLGKGGMGGCVYDKGCSAFGKLKLRSILRSGIVLTIFGLLVMPVGLVTGQQIISAQSGIIDHLEGNVSLELFMRNNETRKQTHWKYLGADFLWNEGFQVMLRSMDYVFIILEGRKRTVEEENKIRRQLPCVPRYGDSCIAP
jgi:hypothetical protein